MAVNIRVGSAEAKPTAPTSPSASTRVVYAALAGNLMVALAQFGGAALSGSTALLTEAIHSLADTTNQILLLVGQRQSRKPADASHPFGYGLEVYFWSFVVAVIVFTLGGAVSLSMGYRHLLAPHPIEQPVLSLVILLLSLAFEGASLAVGVKAYKRIVRGRTIDGRKVRIWDFIAISKDPNLYSSLLEDMAALAGIGIAAVGILLSWQLHWLRADGIASIAIGSLLVANAFVLMRATRSLIAGEGVNAALFADLCRAAHDDRLREVAAIKTLHLGPDTILVALTLRIDPAAATFETVVRDITARMMAADHRVSSVYARPLA